jgi:pimeloyl-ACP methyl ester carboxylesterase
MLASCPSAVTTGLGGKATASSPRGTGGAWPVWSKHSLQLGCVVTAQRSIPNDGLEIAFDESGRGRPVVWLHGINEDRLSWAPVTDQLDDEMRCVRIDFRGHGASSRRPPYDLGGLVSDVTSVISATCTEPPVVVGHSLGGIVATIAATMGVTGPVICIDQPLILDEFAEIVHSLAARLRDPATYADALMEEKLALGMGLVPEPIFRELERKTRTSDQNVVLDIWKPMLDWDLSAMEAAKPVLEQVLRTINVPYLALHGQPVEAGYEEWFRSTNPAATIELWTGMGHWLHLVDPARFANRVRDFLSQYPEG